MHYPRYQSLIFILQYKQAVANKPYGITNYALDSEPDDNDSDDESKATTKHEIPLWAHGMYLFREIF